MKENFIDKEKELKEKIQKDVEIVLNEFLKVEVGNKVTQFNIQGLHTMLQIAINKGVQNAK